MLRTTILIILGLATAFWLWFFIAALSTYSGPIGGLLIVIALFVGAVYLVLGLPAFILALEGRFLGPALVLALLALAFVVDSVVPTTDPFPSCPRELGSSDVSYPVTCPYQP